jgi:hypothetical protein
MGAWMRIRIGRLTLERMTGRRFRYGGTWRARTWSCSVPSSALRCQRNWSMKCNRQRIAIADLSANFAAGRATISKTGKAGVELA